MAVWIVPSRLQLETEEKNAVKGVSKMTSKRT